MGCLMSALVGARFLVTILTKLTPDPKYLRGLLGDIPVKLLLVIISSLWHKFRHEVYMLKYLCLFCFFTVSLNAITVERFRFEDHDYLRFECKTVLHDPECHKCKFARFVSYDLYDLHYQIIERAEVSPFRYEIPTPQ